MGFLQDMKDMKIKNKFKKGYLVDISEMPDSQDRDRFIVNYSIKNNIPILVSKQERWGILKYINPNVELYRFAKNFTIEIRDLKFPRGVLVDESVDVEMTAWLMDRSIKINGGFR